MLESLLQQKPPKDRLIRIEKELAALRKGEQGEKNAAYYLNFDFGASPNWAVLHDVRLEEDGQVAQIDHLLINRFLEFYVLESKNFAYGVKIDENGEFLAFYNRHYQGIPSPIEQNRRHIVVLEKCFKNHDIMPKRLGINIKPTFINYVLMSPSSRIIRPKAKTFDTSMVIKADALRTVFDKEFEGRNPVETLTTAAKMCRCETIKELARKVAALHRPKQMDFATRFGITLPKIMPKTELMEKNARYGKGGYFCWQCKRGVPDVVADYCWSYKHIYGNKVYCKECQKNVLEKRKTAQES